jgi:putative isomerase
MKTNTLPQDRFAALKTEASTLGKPSWRPLLKYVAELHERSTHPARPPFALDWEEIGPGYCYGPAFGHWDIIHQALDTLPMAPEHARDQLINALSLQRDNGYLPATGLFMGETRFFDPGAETQQTHPPVWPFFVDEFLRQIPGDPADLLRTSFTALQKQIGWFERERKAAEGEGFFYNDILNRRWESGVDEGIRFDDAPAGAFACVDATAHVYGMYEAAVRWADILGLDSTPFAVRAKALRHFIQNCLFDPTTGFFHDSWAVGQPDKYRLAFEGMWPIVLGAATNEQAARVIQDNFLETSRFFTKHPLATVGRSDPAFELRMWRGPAWNSMTYWAALGCVRYDYPDAARSLLEPALDLSAFWFEKTGTIWEFYHPEGGDPRTLDRKPDRPQHGPCPDYLGHNPLFAMARLYDFLC